MISKERSFRAPIKDPICTSCQHIVNSNPVNIPGFQFHGMKDLSLSFNEGEKWDGGIPCTFEQLVREELRAGGYRC